MPVPYDKKVPIPPLTELWTGRGPVPAAKGREHLSSEDIKELLRHGEVRFIEIVPGGTLDWKAPHLTMSFWKDQVKPHLYTEAKPYREDYPGEWFYTADEWLLESGGIAIVLWMHH